MPFSNEISFLEPSAIVVAPERQRKEIQIVDLVGSIKERGIMNPLIVQSAEGSVVLVAGERRLRAALELGLPEVPVRFTSQMSPIELEVVELEENLKRENLSWQDQAQAIAKIHQLYVALDEEWTQAETARAIDVSGAFVSEALVLTRELKAENQHVVESDTRGRALSAIARKKQRAAVKELEQLIGADPLAEGPEPPAEPPAAEGPEPSGEAPEPSALPPSALPPSAILTGSFLEWSQQYSGPKFNLIHCDFPYGTNLFGGPQGGAGQQGQYSDTPEVYFQLLEAFCQNLNNFCSLSAHVMFWFSMKHYEPTKAMFRNLAPSIEWYPHLLVWNKSDNAGIIGDARRDPRHTHEVALFGRRGGRMLVKSKADCYSAPTDRALHPSAKPVPVLKHFFEMLVDEHTEMLDPTCGAGSALRAAEALGAPKVFGVELDEENAQTARDALRRDRALRHASSAVA